MKPDSQSLPLLPVRAWHPLRGPFARWPRAADAALAVFIFLWTVFVTDDDVSQSLVFRAAGDVPVIALFAFALACGPLYWRRQQPLIVLGVNLAVLSFSMGLNFPDSAWSLPFALYSVGRYTADDRWSHLAVLVTVTLTATSTVFDGEPAGNIGLGIVIVFLIWYVGRYIRVRSDYLNLLRERATQLEQEQAVEARRAVSEERTRIARELHDVVAHCVSMMTVQAAAAKTVAGNDPDRALQAMGAVESAGRQALDELRHLMGVLRPDAEINALGPQPRLADLPGLVEQLNDAGLQVSLETEGALTDLAARVELSAYRIVQEALTNVLKHAGPGTRAEVELTVNPHEITITVRDNGGGALPLPGSGHGIVGMRERALLLGGSLEANHRPGGGFQVVAHLPIGEHAV